MTSLHADTLAFVGHLPASVCAFLASSSEKMNSSIVPVVLSNQEIWNSLRCKINAVTKERKLIKIFSKFSHTMQFADRLSFSAEVTSTTTCYDYYCSHKFETVWAALNKLIKNTRYFTRTLKRVSLTTSEQVALVCNNMVNLHSIDIQRQKICESMNDSCRWLADDDLELICKCTLLTELDLSTHDDITNTGLEHIANLKSLKVLKLAGLTKITSLSFLNKLRNLHTLDLSGCKSLTDDSFSDFIFEDSLIQTLDLQRCPGFSLSTFENVGALPSLNCAFLDNNSSLAPSFEHIFKHFTHLQRVEFHYDRRIPSQGEGATDSSLEILSRATIPSSSSSPIRVLKFFGTFTDVGFRSLTHLRNLEVLEISFNHSESFTGDIGENDFFSPSLREITLHEVPHLTGAGLQSMLKGLSLRSLYIEWGFYNDKDAMSSSEFEGVFPPSCFNSLESLRLNQFRFKNLEFLKVFRNSSALKRLSLEGSSLYCRSRSEEREIVEALRDEADPRGEYDMPKDPDDHDLRHVGSEMAGIFHELEKDVEYDDEIFWPLHEMKSLEELDLTWTGINNANFRHYVSKLTSLKRLYLDCCEDLTDRTLREIASNLFNLQILHIRVVGYDEFSTRGVFKMIKKLPNLKEVKVNRELLHGVSGYERNRDKSENAKPKANDDDSEDGSIDDQSGRTGIKEFAGRFGHIFYDSDDDHDFWGRQSEKKQEGMEQPSFSDFEEEEEEEDCDSDR